MTARQTAKYEHMCKRERQLYFLLAISMWSAVGLLWLAVEAKREEAPASPAPAMVGSRQGDTLCDVMKGTDLEEEYCGTETNGR